MGFLTGKTAIITGGGRAVLSDGSVDPSDMVLQQLMPKKVRILFLQEEM